MKPSFSFLRIPGICCLLMFCGPGTGLSLGQDVSESASKPDNRKIDQTGINWVMPFSQVLEKAKKENRIIAIKMIAFGTNAAGCW